VPPDFPPEKGRDASEVRPPQADLQGRSILLHTMAWLSLPRVSLIQNPNQESKSKTPRVKTKHCLEPVIAGTAPPRTPEVPASAHILLPALMTVICLLLAGTGMWLLLPLPPLPGQRGGASSPAADLGSRLADALAHEAARRSELLIPDWQGTERLTFLVMGLDQRGSERTRTDTMLVISVDPVTRSAAVISIPRDLYVFIPGYGNDRINEAYPVGGPDLARRVVSEVLQLPVPYYVVVDFRGFKRIINTLGGVVVDVEHPIYDPDYPADTGNDYITVDIKAGRQWMDGDTALKYVRSRMSDPEGDFGRSKRQERLLLALKDQVLRPATLARAPVLLAQLQDTVSTNFPLRDVPSLAKLGMSIDRSRIVTRVIDTSNGLTRPFVTRAGAWVLQPDLPRLRAFVREALAASQAAAAASPPSVERASVDDASLGPHPDLQRVP
jgi:LCP family protein required for cell wall assembly